MLLEPQARPESDNERFGIKNQSFQLMPVMTGDKFTEIVNYPVIVESWEKKKNGSKRRKWMSEFDDSERRVISSYYARFYRWYLLSGTPRKIACRMRTLVLLKKAVAFFASI